jgi:GNAT superfamily N-acetyltransferase
VSDDRAVELLTEKHGRVSFDCGGPSLNEYLQRSARQNAEPFLGRTYVLVVPGQTRIEGYYTISSGLVVRQDLPEKRLPRYPVPIFLMERLAVDRQAQGQGFGELLLQNALKRSAQLAEQARSFCRRYGFTGTADDPLRLYLPIKRVLQTSLSKT